MENFDIVSFLKKAVELKASDVHICAGEKPIMRIGDNIVRSELPILSDNDVRQSALTILPDKYKDKLETFTDFDIAYELPGISRFRVNIHHIMAGFAITLRIVPCNVIPLADLKLPESVSQFSKFNNGLVLITGSTGSGKSTSIASIINEINLSEAKHIITVEDPVEFVFKNEKSMVSQRQVKIDTESFLTGVKYALRQDPDVIFVGEIRDTETIMAALNAADTGHLVFSTIHTNGAIPTITRIINMFEATSRDFIRLQLAKVLRGTISQKLLPTADGNGRIAACEVLMMTSAVQDYVERNKLEDIYELMQNGAYNGMNTMNMSLYDLYKRGIITEETATSASDNPNELQQMFRGVR